MRSNTKPRVKVAVIGLGVWGRCHVEAYASLPQAEVVAICDSNKERLQEIGERYDIKHRFTDRKKLWALDELALVNVCTPESEHLQPVMEALRAGKHVLVEKPAATRHAEATEMHYTAEAANRYLMPGHILRFDPRYAAAHRAIRAGEIGDIASIHSRRSRPHADLALYGRSHTVSVLMAHDIDLAVWYAGHRVRKVRAYERYLTGGKAPDLVWACLEFENGLVAFLESSYLTPDAANCSMDDALEVLGSKGKIEVQTRQGGFELWNESGRTTTDYLIHNEIAGEVRGDLRAELQYLCNCIIESRPPTHVPFGDAVHGVAIAEAIIRSATERQEVTLPGASDH